MDHIIREAVSAALTFNRIPPENLDAAVEDVIRAFRTRLLDFVGGYRDEAQTAETPTLRALSLIFAEQVENIANQLRPARQDVCKNPDTATVI